jgi:hypothetical protein
MKIATRKGLRGSWRVKTERFMRGSQRGSGKLFYLIGLYCEVSSSPLVLPHTQVLINGDFQVTLRASSQEVLPILTPGVSSDHHSQKSHTLDSSPTNLKLSAPENPAQLRPPHKQGPNVNLVLTSMYF